MPLALVALAACTLLLGARGESDDIDPYFIGEDMSGDEDGDSVTDMLKSFDQQYDNTVIQPLGRAARAAGDGDIDLGEKRKMAKKAQDGVKPTGDRNVGSLLKSFDDAYDTTVTGAFKQSEDAFQGFDKMFSANTPQALRKRMLAEEKEKSKHAQLKEAGTAKPTAEKAAAKTEAKTASRIAKAKAYASGSKKVSAAAVKKEEKAAYASAAAGQKKQDEIAKKFAKDPCTCAGTLPRKDVKAPSADAGKLKKTASYASATAPTKTTAKKAPATKADKKAATKKAVAKAVANANSKKGESGAAKKAAKADADAKKKAAKAKAATKKKTAGKTVREEDETELLELESEGTTKAPPPPPTVSQTKKAQAKATKAHGASKHEHAKAVKAVTDTAKVRAKAKKAQSDLKKAINNPKSKSPKEDKKPKKPKCPPCPGPPRKKTADELKKAALYELAIRSKIKAEVQAEIDHKKLVKAQNAQREKESGGGKAYTAEWF